MSLTRMTKTLEIDAISMVRDDRKWVVLVQACEPEATFEELVAFARTLY